MPSDHRRKYHIRLSDTERDQLTSIAASRSLPHGIVRRAQIILQSADGHTNQSIRQSLGVSNPTITQWRREFSLHGLAGLYDAPRSGRPRTHDDDEVALMLRTVLETRPKDSTHWTVRGVASRTGISKSSVQRYFTLFGVQPHRTKSFRLSPDPFFIEKVRDIVGLYLNPPDHALVLCVDEKSQIQALERIQPNLPIGLGYVEGVTSNYNRHGTTTLFAALDIKTGEIFAKCKSRQRHQEFLDFLNELEANMPKDLELHLILDNYTTHRHQKVKAWLAWHPRYHLHFTPSYASWINQVERWFALITQRAIRRGSFRNVRELVERIDHFVKIYNETAKPFVWVATGDSIIAKLSRLMKRISGTGH